MASLTRVAHFFRYQKTLLEKTPIIIQVVHRSSTARTKRLEKLGIGPDGKPLPIPNTKRLYPRLYPCLIVNQDGSTYQIYHHYPYEIITLPLDPNTLTLEQRQAREKEKRQAQQPKYFSEDDYLEEEWDHTQYKDLLR